MGTYVEFIRCPPGGPLAQILAHIEGYRAWYVDVFAEDGDPAVLGLITAVAERGVAALDDLGPASYPVIDRWVTDFYGFYCDGSYAPRLSRVETSMLRVAHYRELHQQIAGLLAPDVSALWRFIYAGRPVAPRGRDTAYISDGSSWVSWWSLAESRLLRRSLPSSTIVGPTFASVMGGGASESVNIHESVLAAVREALKTAEESGCGLIVTAF